MPVYPFDSFIDFERALLLWENKFQRQKTGTLKGSKEVLIMIKNAKMTWFTARALYSQVLGKEMEKKVALEARSTCIKAVEVMRFGILFHIRAVATGKAQSLAVDS